MSDSPLRGRILRLAVEDAALRPKLVKILREAGGLTAGEDRVLKVANGYIPAVAPGQPQPIIIQQVVQGPNPAAGAPIGLIQSPAAPVPVAPAPVVAPVAPLAAPVGPNQSTIGIPEQVAPVAPVSGLFVPERAQKGFQSELYPEMQKLLGQGLTPEQVSSDMLVLLRDSFAKKDMLYNILIRYQSSFESNEDYQRNLENLIVAWATSNRGV